MIAKSMREKGIEPLRRIQAADPKSALYRGLAGSPQGASAPSRTEPRPNRAENVTNPVTRAARRAGETQP